MDHFSHDCTQIVISSRHKGYKSRIHLKSQGICTFLVIRKNEYDLPVFEYISVGGQSGKPVHGISQKDVNVQISITNRRTNSDE